MFIPYVAKVLEYVICYTVYMCVRYEMKSSKAISKTYRNGIYPNVYIRNIIFETNIFSWLEISGSAIFSMDVQSHKTCDISHMYSPLRRLDNAIHITGAFFYFILECGIITPRKRKVVSCGIVYVLFV